MTFNAHAKRTLMAAAGFLAVSMSIVAGAPAANAQAVGIGTVSAPAPAAIGAPATAQVAAAPESTPVATATELRGLAYNKLDQSDKKRTNARKHLESSALIPLKLVAVTSAAAVGTPIAIVRCESRRMNTYAEAVHQELAADDGNVGLVAVSAPGQSLRAVGTVGEGVLNGLLNSLEGWDEPFSKRSFSLGQIHEFD